MDDSMFVGDSTAYSRRSFLKGVGATAGFTLLAGVGLGATGCATQEDGANLAETGHTVVTPQGTYEVYETDMLVCGCGYAGMSAAANAAKSGLNVTVVEKGPFGSGGVAGMNFDFLTTWIYDPNFYQFDSQIGPVLNQEVNLAARRYAEERNEANPACSGQGQQLDLEVLNKGQMFPERNEDGSYHIFSDIEAAKIYMVEGSFPRHETDRLTMSPWLTIADRPCSPILSSKTACARAPWASICPRAPSECFAPRPR